MLRIKQIATVILLTAIICYGSTAQAAKGSSTVRKIFTAVNEKRRSNDRQPLEMNDELNGIAEEHSRNMAAHHIPFGHDGFDKRYRLITGQWAAITAMAENVAKNTSVEDVVETWWKSAGHHKNMLGAYTHTGIGIAKGADGYFYVTQIFVKKQ